MLPDHQDESWPAFFSRNLPEEQPGWDQRTYLSALKATLRSPCGGASAAAAAKEEPAGPSTRQPPMVARRPATRHDRQAAFRSGVLRGLLTGEAAVQLVFARLLAAIARAVAREAALLARWRVHRAIYARPRA